MGGEIAGESESLEAPEWELVGATLVALAFLARAVERRDTGRSAAGAGNVRLAVLSSPATAEITSLAGRDTDAESAPSDPRFVAGAGGGASAVARRRPAAAAKEDRAGAGRRAAPTRTRRARARA